MYIRLRENRRRRDDKRLFLLIALSDAGNGLARRLLQSIDTFSERTAFFAQTKGFCRRPFPDQFDERRTLDSVRHDVAERTVVGDGTRPRTPLRDRAGGNCAVIPSTTRRNDGPATTLWGWFQTLLESDTRGIRRRRWGRRYYVDADRVSRLLSWALRFCTLIMVSRQSCKVLSEDISERWARALRSSGGAAT